jgi:amino acid adenylation domain-containing protein/non-ribosomal peptide synthase protein (TIGR01720 family)
MQQNVIEGFRLSPQQRPLWRLQQESPAYYSACAVEIEGDLQRETLKDALRRVVFRHEILRTNFMVAPGVDFPLQVISENCDFDWLEIEGKDAPADRSHLDELIDRLFQRESSRRRDLETGPPLSATLLTLTDRTSLLVVALPAVCADGKTFENLVSEISRNYDVCLGKAMTDAPPIQYVQFSEWRQGLIEAEEDPGEDGAKLFNGYDELRLPHENHKGGSREFKVSTLPIAVDSRLFGRLEEIARRYGTNLETLILACWWILLGRLTAESDIVVSRLFDGRVYEEIQETFGLFAHYLPVQRRIEIDDSFPEFLKRVAESEGELHQREQYILKQKSRLSIEEAFDQNFPPFSYEYYDLAKSSSASGISFSLRRTYICLERFKLKLYCRRLENSLLVELHFDEELFDREAGRLIAGGVETLLNGVVQDPEKRVGDLDLLTDADRYVVLSTFNETDRPYRRQSISRLFEQQVEQWPDRIAVTFGDRCLSYAALDAEASRLALRLKESGVGAEIFVGICCERSPEMVVGVLGILKAGGAYVPLDASAPEERLALMLEDTKAPVILASDSMVDRLPPFQGTIISLNERSQSSAENNLSSHERAAGPENAAYVIYTSGTTGRPKGVVVVNRGVANLAHWQAENFKLQAGGRIAQYFSYNFDGAVGETFMALLNGATLVMLDSNEASADQLIETINFQRLNVMVLVPSLLKQLDPDRILEPRAVTIVSVGEACPVDLATQWSTKCNFMNGYGPTEYTVYSHLWKAEPEAVGGLHAIPIGKPIDNSKSVILDSELNPVPLGVVGQIYISGDGIARGYLNRADLTGGRFIPNPFVREETISDCGMISVERANREIMRFKEAKRAILHNDGWGRTRIPKRLSAETAIELVKELDDDLIQATAGYIDAYYRDEIAYESFCRYFFEGVYGSYSSCGINIEVFHRLFSTAEFEGLKGVDFGFGNGEILKTLSEAGIDVHGFDLSPFFVQRARDRGFKTHMVKIDADLEDFRRHSHAAENSQDLAVSTLVLDRVERPLNLLKNLFFVLKPGGRFAIQTLLPIIPVDDGDLTQPIVYTAERNRLTSGKNAERDRRELALLLGRLGASEINVCRIPYVVVSRDGIQDYTVWSFYGRKRQIEKTVWDRPHEQRMYCTGDLGRYKFDGNIEFLGRIDHQVKLRGFRIELGEIETVLEQHHTVQQAAVCMREDVPGEKRLAAYVVPRPGRLPELSELRSHLERKLPSYMTPAAMVILKALPVTVGGKVDRKALPRPDGARPEIRQTFIAPRTPAENVLAEIWSKALQVERVGVADNFFQLGGDSILSIQIVARANRAGLRLTPRELFQHPTIAELAELIEEAAGRENGQADVIPLTPFQQRFLENHYYTQHPALLFESRHRLDPSSLEERLSQLLNDHEALNLQFEPRQSGWRQVVVRSGKRGALTHLNLAGVREEDQRPAIEIAHSELQERLQSQEGPPLQVALFDRDSGQGSLILIAAHSLVADEPSLHILREEIERGIARAGQVTARELSEKSSSFAQWAEWLASAPSDALPPGPDDRLEERAADVDRLPVDYPEGLNTAATRRIASISLDAIESQWLMGEVLSASRARPEELFLTALAQAFACWRDKGRQWVDVERSGRKDVPGEIDLTRTIGQFGYIDPVLLDVGESLNPMEALKAVKQQLRRIPQRGVSHEVAPQITQNELATQSQVYFRYVEPSPRIAGDPSLIFIGEPGLPPAKSSLSRRYLLEVVARHMHGRLEIDFAYSESLYRRETIEALTDHFLEALRLMAGSCGEEEMTGYTPSDFPLLRLSQQQFDNLMQRFSERRDR